MLEEAFEFLGVAVGGRQELRRVQLIAPDRLDVVDLGDELAAEALDLAGYADRIAPLEARRQAVHLAEGPCGDRPAAVPELQREVDRAVAGGQPVLANARVGATEALTRPQLGNRGRGGSSRRRDLVQLLCGLHVLSLQVEPDTSGCPT